MADFDDNNSGSHVDKESVNEVFYDEEVDGLEEALKELTELMEAESKPHFTNI